MLLTEASNVNRLAADTHRLDADTSIGLRQAEPVLNQSIGLQQAEPGMNPSMGLQQTDLGKEGVEASNDQTLDRILSDGSLVAIANPRRDDGGVMAPGSPRMSAIDSVLMGFIMTWIILLSCVGAVCVICRHRWQLDGNIAL